MRATLQKTKNGYGLKEMVAFVSSVRPEHSHQKLSLKNCQAIEFGYDLDELVDSNLTKISGEPADEVGRKLVKLGFKIAMRLIGDKKFTEADIRDSIAFGQGMELWKEDDQIGRWIDSRQQTEWEVEVEMEGDENQCDGCKAGHNLIGNYHVKSWNAPYMTCQKHKYQKPKLDANGCLILKRI